MKMLLLFFSSALFLSAHARITLTHSQAEEARRTITDWWPQSTRFMSDVLSGNVISWAESESPEKNLQTLHTKVVGIHPRTCERGLRKISRYETYQQHVSFVKESRYDDVAKKIYFLFDHALLPFPMVLSFVLPRIERPGSYPFTFTNGIFKDLHGTIKVASVGNRCLYFLEADWQGPSTHIPDMAVGAFAQTLSKMGLEHLIRVSSF